MPETAEWIRGKEALCEVGKDVFCDFDSQVYYRLVHNLLWIQINKDNIDRYLQIFMHHQKMEFKDIARDERFMRKEVNTLYVPKDNISAEVKHWHGAAPDSWFSHLAVEVPGEESGNEWCEPVSEEEYGRLK